MPLFEYRCEDCQKPFEQFVTTERKATCPGCGGEHLEKMLSRPGMVSATSSRPDACAAPAPMCGGGGCGCAH
jgi:putative FmdB family regulatory protein